MNAKDMTAEQIAEEYRRIPEYDRDKDTERLCSILAGELADQVCKVPYSELPHKERHALLVGIINDLPLYLEGGEQ